MLLFRLIIVIALLCSGALLRASEQSESVQREYVQVTCVGDVVAARAIDGRLTIGVLEQNGVLKDVRCIPGIQSLGSNESGVVYTDSAGTLVHRDKQDRVTVLPPLPGNDIIQCLARSSTSDVVLMSTSGRLFTLVDGQEWKVVDSMLTASMLRKSRGYILGIHQGNVWLRGLDGIRQNLFSFAISADLTDTLAAAIIQYDTARYVVVQNLNTSSADTVAVNARAHSLTIVGNTIVLWGLGFATIISLDDPGSPRLVVPQRTGPILTSVQALDAVATPTSAIFVGTKSGIVEVDIHAQRINPLSLLTSFEGSFGSIASDNGVSLLVGSTNETVYRSTTGGITWTPHRRTSDIIRRNEMSLLWPMHGTNNGYVQNGHGELFQYFDHGDSLQTLSLSGSYVVWYEGELLLLGNRRLRLFDREFNVIDDTVLPSSQVTTVSAVIPAPDTVLIAGTLRYDTPDVFGNTSRAVVYRYVPSSSTMDSVVFDAGGITLATDHDTSAIVVAYTLHNDGRRTTSIWRITTDLRVTAIVTDIEGLPMPGYARRGDTFYLGLKDRILLVHLESGQILDTIFPLYGQDFTLTSIQVQNDSVLYVSGANSVGVHDIRKIVTQRPTTKVQLDEVQYAPAIYVHTPYPVPSSSHISIPLEWNMSRTEPAILRVYDVFGREVLTETRIEPPPHYQSVINIDVSSLQRAVYYITVTRGRDTQTRIICRE